VHEGQIADTFGPGLYSLETNNMPVLTTLQHWDHGFQSPFKSEIYFVNLRRFTDMKWGTRSPIMCRDAEFGMVRLRAFGSYTMRVTDPAKFLVEIVGTDGEFTTQEIEFQIRNYIVTHFSQIIATSGIPVLDMAANTIDLAKLVHARITPLVAAYGLELPAFMIENISLPAEVEAALDRRTSMGVLGDLGKYTEFSTAEALRNEGGGGSGLATGLGAGLGMAMAERMSRGLGGADQGGAPPPPPPAERTWRVAVGGESTGPYSRAELARMAMAGEITRDTYFWTNGDAEWRRGRAIDELAEFFGGPSPPPPS
jgi:membrane protease subunit (stomatin/prohibitin family)